jgi:predicted acyl esterase
VVRTKRALALVAVAVVMASLFSISSNEVVGAAPAFEAHGSINQVWVVDLVPGETVELLDAGDAVVATGVADSLGSFLFREVAVGSGYQVRQDGEVADGLVVTGPTDHPDSAFYDAIDIPIGYGYVPTRDGTLLSVNVTPPEDYDPTQTYPVLVDYSGYDPSRPGQVPQEAAVFGYQGYFVVGVNVRGTTCSGGAFDYFETLQSTDGYDVIEAVARQPWSNGDVGMVGISYPGISQLFVAATQPPHLRAISPVSVIADTVRSTLFPGGLLNDGFALDWATDRVNGAKPAASGWARDLIDAGDTVCADNQKMRLQSADLLGLIEGTDFYEPRFDALAPRTFVDQIQVPVYLSGSFQDEQTGGHFSTMIDEFDPSVPLKATLTNGTHVEPLGPQQLQRLTEFIDFYVGKRIPKVDSFVRVGAPAIYLQLFGTPVNIQPDRFDAFASYGAALAAYEAEPKVRVLWENGAGGTTPGAPVGTAETLHADWPIPEAQTTRWYLQPDGKLSTSAPTVGDDEPRGASSYTYDPGTKSAGTFGGSTEAIWKASAQLNWETLDEGSARSFVTEPFTQTTAIAGMGSVDLWLRTEAADTGVEVTITEVRPDGTERYVQSGWLRAEARALDAAVSTELEPFPTLLESDAAPMPQGEFEQLRVALFPFAHVFRPGTRLRVNVEAPGGNQPFWEFEPVGEPGTVNEVGHSIGRPSSVQLPVLPAGAAPAVPATLPACPSLRNQPCRTYSPDRIPTDVTGADDQAGGLRVTWTAPPAGGQPSAYRVAVESVDPLVTAEGSGLAPTATAAAAEGVFEVGGDATSFVFDGAEVGASYRATVQAVYGGAEAPVSNASLPATVGEPVPTTTTTAPTTTTTETPTDDVDVAAEASEATSGGSSGTLPVTGIAIGLLLVVGLALSVGGGLVSRAGRRAPTPDGAARSDR